MQLLKHKPHLTAISRKTLPAPVQWLIRWLNNPQPYKILDFGCGKCASINPPHWDSYDPYFNPNGIKQKRYRTIFCTYVLCVLPKEERLTVLTQIQSLLSTNGTAYISVRNDRPKQGWGFSKRNTYQGRSTNLQLQLVYSNSMFRIYSLTKETDLSKVLP